MSWNRDTKTARALELLRMKGLADLRGKVEAECNRRIGIPHLSLLLRGQRRMHADTLSVIARAANITMDEAWRCIKGEYIKGETQS